MKIQELRIGNIIDVFGECEVIAINSENRNIKVQRPGRSEGFFITEWAPIESMDVKPVELREEWLLKFGFLKKGYTYTKGNILIWDFNTCGLFSYMLLDERDLQEHDNNEYNFKIYSTEICKIQYLHELQNIWFSCTKNELTLNSHGSR